MDPAGPNFYDGKVSDFNAPLDEKLDKTDADLVDAIHSDSDIFGTKFALGHTDFYVGKSTEHLGSDQYGTWNPVQDHGHSYELMKYSISHPSECWAHFPCHGQPNVKDCEVSDTCKPYPPPFEQNYPHNPNYEEVEKKNEAMKEMYANFAYTYSSDCKSNVDPRPHFGYWYDGSRPGQYGIVLGRRTCWQCVSDAECSGAEDKCDVTSHECVQAECLRDHHCSSDQTCVNNKCDPPKPQACPGGRRKRQADQAQCSSEPSEQCKQKSGYCGNPSSCPGTVLDNLCPGGQDNKCCVGMPFQEEKCEAAGGVCGDKCVLIYLD